MPSLDQEDPLEKGMATHSSILAWRIPKDRGAWEVTVHWATESDTAERLTKVFPNSLTPHTLEDSAPPSHPPSSPLTHPPPPASLLSSPHLTLGLCAAPQRPAASGAPWRALSGGKSPSVRTQCFSRLRQDPDKDRASSHPRVTKSSSDPRASGLPLISTLKLLCPFPLSRSVSH